MYTPIPLCKQVEQINPDLEFIKYFSPASSKVCLVRDHAGVQHYILKLADKRKHPIVPESLHLSRIDNILREERVLKELSSLDGITHLVEAYHSDNHVAILKEFQEGLPLDESDSLYDYYVIRRTIENMHAQGLVRIDVKYDNIIKPVKPGDTKLPPKIVDLGSCIFYNEVSFREFDKFEKEDLAQLDFMFFRIL